MLSTKAIFQEIRQNPKAFNLVFSIAAKGETQGGWENERIAELLEDNPVLAEKVKKHGADETKHGLMFKKILRKAGLEPIEIPVETDYCLLLEQRGVGLSHERLIKDEPLSKDELLNYLVHSKITEERASEEVERMLGIFDGDPDLEPSLKVIAVDEVNHLSYSHEELLLLSSESNEMKQKITKMLREYYSVECVVNRDVSLRFVEEVSHILGWPPFKTMILKFGIHLGHHLERVFFARKKVSLRQPMILNAMGPGDAANRIVTSEY